MKNTSLTTCGECLVKHLEACGGDIGFSIPGVLTVELYLGLPLTLISTTSQVDS